MSGKFKRNPEKKYDQIYNEERKFDLKKDEHMRKIHARVARLDELVSSLPQNDDLKEVLAFKEKFKHNYKKREEVSVELISAKKKTLDLRKKMDKFLKQQVVSSHVLTGGERKRK